MHPSIITKETTNTSSIPLNIHIIHIGSLAHPSRNVIAAHPPSNAANTNQIRKNPVPDPFPLIQKMNDFAAAVADAGNNYNPGGIANYCYELTKEFNQFYHDYSILNAESEAEKITRLVLAANVAKILKNGMALLGIEVPERM